MCIWVLAMGFPIGTNDRLLRWVARPPGDIDGRLGGAIEVVQPAVEALEEAVLDRVGQGLAAADDAVQAGAVAAVGLVEEELQHGRHEVEGGDGLLLDDLERDSGCLGGRRARR